MCHASEHDERYFPNPIPRYCTLQQHSGGALELLEHKSGCKVENYSFCEQKKCFLFINGILLKEQPLSFWSWRSFGQCHSTPLHPPSTPPRAVAVQEDLSPPKQPALKCFWSAAPGALTRSSLSSPAHSNLGDFNLPFSRQTHGAISKHGLWEHRPILAPTLPGLQCWHHPAPSSATLSPTSPVAPLSFLTPTQPLGWGGLGAHPSSDCSTTYIYTHLRGGLPLRRRNEKKSFG